MTTLWLPDELAERVRIAATARGLTPQQLAVQLTLEGLERLRLLESLEHLVAAERSPAPRAATPACEHLADVLDRVAAGAGRYDIELTDR